MPTRFRYYRKAELILQVSLARFWLPNGSLRHGYQPRASGSLTWETHSTQQDWYRLPTTARPRHWKPLWAPHCPHCRITQSTEAAIAMWNTYTCLRPRFKWRNLLLPVHISFAILPRTTEFHGNTPIRLNYLRWRRVSKYWLIAWLVIMYSTSHLRVAIVDRLSEWK